MPLPKSNSKTGISPALTVCLQALRLPWHRSRWTGTQAISPYVEGAIRAGLPNLNPRQAELFSDMVADSDPNCVVRTDQILQFFGIDRPFHATLMILVGYLLVLHLLTFAGLRFALFRDRK